MKRAVLISLLTFIISCAPPVKKDRCQFYYTKIVEASYKEEPVSIRGNIFVHGAYLIFYGKLDRQSSIVVRSPFGKRLFSVEYTKDNVCIKIPDSKKMCGKNLDIYWDYLNLKLPFDLKQILTGRFKIDKNIPFYCSEKGITVINNGAKIYYVENRPVRIEYKGFSLLYSYENGKIKKITVKEEGKELLRIYIREMERL